MRTSPSHHNRVPRLTALLMAVAVTAAAVPIALADEADDLAKQADKALRQAERLMHNGKADEAGKELDAVDKLLAKIEAAKPDPVKLKTLRGKVTKLRKDLERRRPKDQPKTPAGEKPNEAKPAKLSRAVRESMDRFEDAKRIIEHAYRWIETSKTKELSKPVAKYYEDIETRTGELAAAMKEVRQRSATEGVTTHPDLDEAQRYLDAAPARLTKVKAEMENFKSEQAAMQAAKEAAEQAAETQAKADAAPDPTQAAQDWKELAILSKEYQDNFQSQSHFKKQGAMAASRWQDWKTRFEPVRERFRQRYGDQNPDIYTAFENVPKPDGVMMPATQTAGIAYGIDLAQCEKRFADWAADWGKDALRLSKSIKKDNTEKLELKYVRAEDAVCYYKLAKLWKSGGDYDATIQEAQAAVAEALPLWKAVLKELKWPGHNTKFAGPGAPDDLAKAALDFLREHPKWTAPEYDDEHVPLAACVEADAWSVSKRAPLTEQPTQHAVDILVAFTGKADPELVYVYHMVFYTAEAAGVKPALPFHYANSKQYARFRMLKENVPAAN